MVNKEKPLVVTTCVALRETLGQVSLEKKCVGLVPTMGALHAGHLSLVEASNRECDYTIVTIFVNPTQFGEGEDLKAYPRQLEDDLVALAAYDVDVVFVPSNEEMYPADYATYVDVTGITSVLEGAHRPIHFRGVATICAKLFILTQAEVAFFGQKDYQQTLVVRRLAKDLNLPTKICVCPTVREPDGLALSSRNVYLSPDERQRASALSRALSLADELAAGGERDAKTIISEMQSTIDAAGGIDVDYLVLVDPDTLEPVDQVNRKTLAAVAAHVGTTRLIDNALIGK